MYDEEEFVNGEVGGVQVVLAENVDSGLGVTASLVLPSEIILPK